MDTTNATLITTTRYDNFSLLRLIACIGVLFVHLGVLIQFPTSIAPFIDAGSSGVMIFFILSGFLGIASIKSAINRGTSLKTWYIKKLLRILPVYYFAILVYFVMYQIILHDVPVDSTGLGWLRYVFCINQIVPSSENFWSNLGVTWTVSVFLVWYLLTPIVNKLVKGTIPATIGFVFFYIIEKIINHTGGYFKPLAYIQYCMLGVVLYYAVVEGRTQLLAAISVVILYLLTVKGSSSALVICCATLIFLCVTMDMQIKKTPLKRLLALSDACSYSVYIMQGISILVISRLNLSNNIVICLVYFGLTFGLTVVAHWGVERPFARFFQ